MFHIVQHNMFGEFGFKTLMDAIHETQVPYALVKIAPFSHELDPDPDVTGQHVMCWGSTALGVVASERGWVPGRFMNENFDMRKLAEGYGEDMLNTDAQFYTLGGVPTYTGLRFIRPVHDTKSFSGQIMDGEEFDYWRKGLYAACDGKSFITVTPETEVMIADSKDIKLEARFFIVDGQVVAGSSYRSLGRKCIYQRIDSNAPLYAPLYEFAVRMVRKWQPIQAFVMDIADLGGEYKVIEINCINHSGFYACDMAAVLRAVEALPY